MLPTVALLLALALLSGCAGGTTGEAESAEADVPEEALEEARAAADALTTDLKKQWAAAMAEGGPVGAIDVCAQIAPEVARKYSVDGTIVRRVALRARNPENRPADAWEEAQLQVLLGQHEAGEMPAEVYGVVEAEDGARAFRYLRPIEMGAVCLNCHGDPATLEEEVKTAIQENYPEDAATGFAAGDFRGAVAVHVPLDGDA
jgi:hypothetical protein